MTRKPMHILLVEDNPGDVRLICQTLKQTGEIRAEVSQVHRLADALERLEQESWDVLLLDLGLPDSDGLETFVKAHTHAPDVPIVVLTGFDDEQAALKAVRNGAQDYLVKGLVGTHLVRALRYAIERNRVELALKMYSERLEKTVHERAQELREAQDDLARKEKLATLGQLAGGVAHELRNPLGVIANAVYFLQETLPEAGEATKEHLALIASEVEALERIIDDLLGFSLGRSPVRERVSVPPLIADVLSKQACPENVAVMVDMPDDLPAVLADRRHAEQALGNLVVNAFQAMPDGGQLSIKARTDQDNMLLLVQDTGHGISPEHVTRLFEPLFTTKVRGTGLGLTVSKSLIEANNGSITVESEEGEGSTFALRLPIWRGLSHHPPSNGSAEANRIEVSQSEEGPS